MIDTTLVGCSWIADPGAEVNYRQLELLDRDDIAPLRILSFDIECAARPGHFPDAAEDPVIQIASQVTEFGTGNPRKVRK